ncbi:MAG: sensor histidine kinase [Solirubrobacterales bacterium]
MFAALRNAIGFDRWPVRWRLAGASAGLTFVILVVFAAVVGRLATDRIHEDFDEELTSASQTLADETRIGFSAGQPVIETGMSLHDFALANDALIRIVDHLGRPIAGIDRSTNLGPPRPGVHQVGELRVANAPISATSSLPIFVQYARSSADVDATVNRLWLFLFAGVLGGTLLATLAGLAVADRAMRPIRALTATAREIAATRDASKKMPEPEADDEVAELAKTLADMLRSLDAAHAEREQALQRQREFLADASHELRTPLTSVLANLELLSEALEPGSEPAEIVDSALGSSQRMRRLVSDLLLLARADAGRATPRARCDLSEIAATAVAEVRPVAGRHGLGTDLPEKLPLQGNPDELHRLVLNLLDNALRHTPEGTSIEISGDVRDDEIELSVSDDGPGLPRGSEDQVFERFSRGKGPADTAADGGTGLGLAIVRAVADSHGGSVSAGRSTDGGARFTVRLPASGAREPETEKVTPI